MDYNEDSIYYSDEDSIDDDNGTPVCVGCQCHQKTCENLMPSTGTVLWGSNEYDVQDYFDLNVRLLSIGVRLKYQCSRCVRCENCFQTNKTFSRSVEYEKRRQNDMSCDSPPQVGLIFCLLQVYF